MPYLINTRLNSAERKMSEMQCVKIGRMLDETVLVSLVSGITEHLNTWIRAT